MQTNNSLATIENIDDLYYKTTLNFTQGSHFEVGQAYAQEIVNILPLFGAIVDNFLYLSAKSAPETPELSTLITRSYNLISDMPQQYKDELVGMTTVFNYPIDQLGDGILSANELLVYEVLHDVIDPGSCSAAAVYGSSSATGSTIVGRNFDWYNIPGASELHNVQIYLNNDSTYDIAGIGFLGQLFPGSVFSENHISGALLDSDMKRSYFPSIGSDSYPADLRFAFEHYDNIGQISYYLLGQQDTHSYIAFLADTNSAVVLENDLEHPSSRGLRTSSSVLRDGATWEIPNTVVAVNSFLLPGTTDEFTGEPSNTKRFASYSSLLSGDLLSQGSINMQDMQSIMSYAGSDGIAKNSGAIYRATNDYPTLQSYILDMGSLELVANFGPTSGNPPHPTYTQVFASSPF